MKPGHAHREEARAVALADDVALLLVWLREDVLSLLRSFLNHRHFLRSERAERTGKSPAELLNGSPHSHWLEMVGYDRFVRS